MTVSADCINQSAVSQFSNAARARPAYPASAGAGRQGRRCRQVVTETVDEVYKAYYMMMMQRCVHAGKPTSPDKATGGTGNVRRAAGLSPEGAEYIRAAQLDESKLQDWDHAGKQPAFPRECLRSDGLYSSLHRANSSRSICCQWSSMLLCIPAKRLPLCVRVAPEKARASTMAVVHLMELC